MIGKKKIKIKIELEPKTQIYHNFRSITSADDLHGNLQGYLSPKDQIICTYLNFKQHIIYVGNQKNNDFIHLTTLADI